MSQQIFNPVTLSLKLKINHDDILVLRNVDLSTYIRTRTFSVFDVFLSWKNCCTCHKEKNWIPSILKLNPDVVDIYFSAVSDVPPSGGGEGGGGGEHKLKCFVD